MTKSFNPVTMKRFLLSFGATVDPTLGHWERQGL